MHEDDRSDTHREMVEMTINDLKKIVPEEHHDKLLEIYIPNGMAEEDRGKCYPLIEVDVVDAPNILSNQPRTTRIMLTADTFQ